VTLEHGQPILQLFAPLNFLDSAACTTLQPRGSFHLGKIVGINLFLHSVRLVLNDWRNALKITGILYLIYAVPSLLIAIMFPVPARPQDAMAAMSAAAPMTLIILVLSIVVFAWMAVAWHRYILLDEFPEGQLPPFDQRRMLSYIGFSLLIGLIAAVAAVIVGSIVGLLVVIIPFLWFIASIAAFAAALIVGYRLAPILAAKAVDKPLTLREAWAATNGANVDIIVLAIVSAVAAFVIDIPAYVVGMLGTPGVWLATIWTLGTGWVKIMVGISVVTTIYGYYVEKRQLPAAGL
jgi:hypothetical protein